MRVVRAALLVCVCLWPCWGDGVALARGDRIAEGRYHLKKANALAGENKCAAAVKEFTAAYEKLHDPVVLFNRAECYRRLGENDKAAEDYRAFLKGFPRAPNRAEIEARIAAMEAPAPAPVTRPEPPAARSPQPPSLPEAEAPPRQPPPPEVRERSRPKVSAPAPRPAPPPAAAPPAPTPPAAPPPALVEAGPAERPPAAAAEPHATSWWVWTALGVAVAAGVAGGFLLLRPHDAAVPSTDLGNYRF